MSTLPHVVNRKIRILGPLPPPYGGVSIYIDRLLDLTKKSGVQVWSYPYKNQIVEHVTFFRHRTLGIVPLLLRDGSGARVFDCSHFHLEYPNPILLPIWLVLKKLLDIHWIKAIHDGSLPTRYRTFSRTKKILFRLGLRHVDEFVVVHDVLRQWLETEASAGQNITVIPALLPDSRGMDQPQMPIDLNERLKDYLLKPKRICSIGAFIPDYGFDQIATVIERLRIENETDFGLLLLDGTFARDEKFRERVLAGREWIQTIENVPNDHVRTILRSSDLFVRGFGQESYGISRIEAIWCGIPVVATNVGETRGMLTYEFGDVPSLHNRIKEALRNFDPESLQTHAALFHREAKHNLERLREVIGIST